MLGAEGPEAGACLGQVSSQSSRGPSRGCSPHLRGLRARPDPESFSPQGVDVDETSCIDWLVIALHVHAARREEKPVSTPGPCPWHRADLGARNGCCTDGQVGSWLSQCSPREIFL